MCKFVHCVCMWAEVLQYTHGGEDNLCQLVLYYLVNPRGQTLVIRLDGNSHLASPPYSFFSIHSYLKDFKIVFSVLELLCISVCLHPFKYSIGFIHTVFNLHKYIVIGMQKNNVGL